MSLKDYNSMSFANNDYVFLRVIYVNLVTWDIQGWNESTITWEPIAVGQVSTDIAPILDTGMIPTIRYQVGGWAAPGAAIGNTIGTAGGKYNVSNTGGTASSPNSFILPSSSYDDPAPALPLTINIRLTFNGVQDIDMYEVKARDIYYSGLQNYYSTSFFNNDYVYFQVTYANAAQWNIYGWNGVAWINLALDQASTDIFMVPDIGMISRYRIGGWSAVGAAANFAIGTEGGPYNVSNTGGSDASSDSFILNPTTYAAPLPPYPFTISFRLTFNGVRNLDGTYEVKARDIIAPICYRGNSQVLVLNKETNEEYVKFARDVVTGDIVKSTSRGFVPVLANLITGLEKEFYLFEKDCFDKNVPNQDFYATRGHPIFINGKEYKASEIPEGRQIITQPEEVFSIMTEKREYIKINNLDVCTWEPNEWAEFVKQNNFVYTKK